jgi:hypothetical protein
MNPSIYEISALTLDGCLLLGTRVHARVAGQAHPWKYGVCPSLSCSLALPRSRFLSISLNLSQYCTLVFHSLSLWLSASLSLSLSMSLSFSLSCSLARSLARSIHRSLTFFQANIYCLFLSSFSSTQYLLSYYGPPVPLLRPSLPHSLAHSSLAPSLPPTFLSFYPISLPRSLFILPNLSASLLLFLSLAPSLPPSLHCRPFIVDLRRIFEFRANIVHDRSHHQIYHEHAGGKLSLSLSLSWSGSIPGPITRVSELHGVVFYMCVYV